MICTYYRHDHCGVCSSIFCLIINLSINKPINYHVNITFKAYNACWSDIFINSDKPCGRSHDIVWNSYKTIMAHSNKPEYSPELIEEWHNIYVQNIHPKENILHMIDEYKSKYPITDSTMVYFRGTDKSRESKRVDYKDYLPHIPEDGPLCIQSDEYAFVEFMLNTYPDRAYYISEFRQNKDKKAIHVNATVNDAIEIMVIVYLMSMGKNFIYNISNVSLITVIIKGNTNNCTCIYK